MDDLLPQFLIEGRDLVAEAHDALHALERDQADAEATDALLRSIHTLKGSVALFDMAPAQRLLHGAETVLERAQRAASPVTYADRAALVATIDQIDRWIDAMETEGGLPGDARTVADDLLQSLEGDEDASEKSADESWIAPLLAKPQFAGNANAGGTVFRYTPDADCFFRGEDPLATVAAVPELRALSIAPDEVWPSLEEMDPFRCISVIEGLSGADEESVREAFRLVPDQVAIARLNHGAAIDVGTSRMADGASTLRVESARLDRLATHAGEMSIAVNGLDGFADRIERHDRALSAEFRRIQGAIESASTALRASIAEVRLVSLAPVLRRLPRLAREVAAVLGKDVEFRIAGDATKADKQIADGLFEPLLHLVRNAIDHGIENRDQRIAAGKPPRGHVSLAIAASGERLLVTLTDDGRGIDPTRVRASAIAKGLIDAEAAAEMSDAQAQRLIFMPGFSTTAAVSDVSGRGVGMDAVRTAVERLQGTIDIDSAMGTGTTFHVSLPLNAITTRLLTVSAGGEPYGLRLDQISETLRVAAAEIQPVGQGQACVIRNRTVPVVDLSRLLGHASLSSTTARLVVTEVTGEAVALRVDALGERIDAMVRGRAGLLASVPAIGGTALLADGGVLLVLDLLELAA
ncbi:chemotaxis protein CheA [Sphingomonas tabacisoli]|uniref:histidine kinase n=1 Tax=Sphingomonas tabacisoli TaxID=2249466 RepID=A0ABW4I4F0_9SPHN